MGAALNVPVAFAWLIGNRVIVQISNLALLLFAARLLSPGEIGEFALASAVSLLMLNVAQAGWRQYVLAWVETPEPPPTVFWSALGAGVVGAIAGMLVAVASIWLFESNDFGWLLLIFSALIPLGAVSSVQFGMLNRRGQLGTIAVVGSATAVLGLVAGFAALMMGAGVYALAVSRIVRDATSLVWTCAVARWIPQPEIDFRELPRVLAFTWKITLAQLLQFGYMYSAEFLIAAFLGMAEVGIYRIGSRICGSVAELIGEPMRVLAWSIFRNAKTPGAGPTPIAEDGQTFVLFSLLFAMPAFVGLAVTSPSVVDVLIGAKWAEAAPVISLLAIARMLLLPDFFSESLLSISGSVRLLPRLAACNIIVSVVFLVLLAPFGLIWAAASQVLAAAALLPIVLFLADVYGGMNWRRIVWLLLPAVAAAAAMAALVQATGSMAISVHSPVWATLTFQVVFGATIYSLLTYGLYPSLRTAVRQRLRRLA